MFSAERRANSSLPQGPRPMSGLNRICWAFGEGDVARQQSGLESGIGICSYLSVEHAQTQASVSLQVWVGYSWNRHGKNHAVSGFSQIISMLNHIRIRMVTLLNAKLLHTEENRLLSSDVERTILESTKLMPGPVFPKGCIPSLPFVGNDI